MEDARDEGDEGSEAMTVESQRLAAAPPSAPRATQGTTMSVQLKPNCNQALEIGQFAVEFMRSARPGPMVEERTKLFHTDSVLCGISAVALGTLLWVSLLGQGLQQRDPEGPASLSCIVTCRSEEHTSELQSH